MKKFDPKSMVVGFVIGIIGVAAVFTVNAASTIRSASFATTKVYFYGNEVPLENPLASIVGEGETNARLYMPLRELLEYMNFIVEWDGQNNSVNLTMRGNPGNEGNTSNQSNSNTTNRQPNTGGNQWFIRDYTQTQANERAITVITDSGTWGPEIDWLIPQMSPDAVYEMVSIYLDKQLFPGITPPTAARATGSRIEIALEYMNETNRNAILDRLAAFY